MAKASDVSATGSATSSTFEMVRLRGSSVTLTMVFSAHFVLPVRAQSQCICSLRLRRRPTLRRQPSRPSPGIGWAKGRGANLRFAGPNAQPARCSRGDKAGVNSAQSRYGNGSLANSRSDLIVALACQTSYYFRSVSITYFCLVHAWNALRYRGWYDPSTWVLQ